MSDGEFETFKNRWLQQIGSHQELYEKWMESEARLGVLVRALRRVVKYRMTAKKAQETIEEALNTIGLAE
jgi:hypothetical protein